MHTTDIAILKLMDLLRFQGKIKSDAVFAKSVGILPQTVSKIKTGGNHFTAKQIQDIIRMYNVNANWIFGIDKKVFNTPNSIEIDLFPDNKPTNAKASA